MAIDDEYFGRIPDPKADATPATRSLDLGLFLTWEKLRVAYNAILGLETIMVLLVDRPRDVSPGSLLPSLVVCLIAANVCFCIGPVLDGFARLIGLRHRVITGVIFVSGTIVSLFLAYGAIKLVDIRGAID